MAANEDKGTVRNMRDRSLSLLRLLTNSYIDPDVAKLLLDEESMEILLDIQAVMVMGMAAVEIGREDVFAEPWDMYEKHRTIIPLLGDLQEEVEWMLQPDYKQYLQIGMRMLSLQEKGEQHVSDSY